MGSSRRRFDLRRLSTPVSHHFDLQAASFRLGDDFGVHARLARHPLPRQRYQWLEPTLFFIHSPLGPLDVSRRRVVSADHAAESYPDHPAMALIRRMNEGEIAALKSDVSERGLIEPLKVLNGELIDGRHRLLVCRELGIEVEVEDIETDRPGGVCSDVSTSLAATWSTYERAQLANAEATRKPGRNWDSEQESNSLLLANNPPTQARSCRAASSQRRNDASRQDHRLRDSHSKQGVERRNVHPAGLRSGQARRARTESR